MLDFKVTNDIRSSHRIQLAGYGLIWTDCYPDMPLNGGYHLLRLGKDDKAGSFEHSYWPHLKLQEQKFILLRELYEDYKIV